MTAPKPDVWARIRDGIPADVLEELRATHPDDHICNARAEGLRCCVDFLLAGEDLDQRDWDARRDAYRR